MPDYIGEIVMRSGDQLPSLTVAIETDTGVPVDVTGATSVDFILSNEDGHDPRVVPGNPAVASLVLPGAILSPTAGIVGYDWQPQDSLRPGVIQLVVVAHLPSGTISAPSDRTARLTVRPDVLDVFREEETVPGRYDLNLYRGDTKTWMMRLWGDEALSAPVPLNGVTAYAQVRNQPDGPIVVPLTCGIELPNVVWLDLDADASNLLPAQGVWDLELHYPIYPGYPSGDIRTVVAGNVTVTLDVTKEAVGV